MRAKSLTEIKCEPSPKWVRVMLGGKFIADSKRVRLLFAGGSPRYYFPKEDVRMDLLEPAGDNEQNPPLGEASFWTVRVGDRIATKSAWTYTRPVSESVDLSGYIAFDWNKMDAWFEEGEEVYGHPHDPYKRIDVLESARHVEVVVLGEKVADTHKPVMLFETGLVTRYYLPRLDVREDLLEPSDTTSLCAYKGKAGYYSVRVGDKIARDIAWYYRYPTTEVSKIAGKIAFYNERVDALYIDGQLQEKPKPRRA
ncbi:MAG: DUF427 domain-containing protein [Chloroflexi bacterium]|nr:DUF427 domain-containing protein [Chloroflexota bacterium]